MSILSPAQMDHLNRAASSAVSCERSTKVPAELTISQWALESGWGAHQPGNNCFGLKAYPGCFGIQTLDTVEVLGGARKAVLANFAVFPSLAACFEKHASLITTAKLYQPAWLRYLKNHDVAMLIKEIGPVYATDPNYAGNLLRVLSMAEVVSCLAVSRKAN